MIKTYLYPFLLYTLCINFSHAQFTDLNEYGFKGKVKIATTTSYQLLKTVNGQLVPEDTTHWYRKEVIYFDQKGNIDSVIQSSERKYYKDFKPSKDTFPTFLKMIKKYFYDSKGKKRTGIEFEKENQNNPNMIVFSWPNPHLYVESKFSKGDGHTFSIDSIWLRKDGRDSAGVYSYSIDNNMKPLSKYVALYNGNNELIGYNEKQFYPDHEMMIRFEILSKDAMGNLTKVGLKMEGEDLTGIRYRTYIYY
jgi:hypothetical protein